MASKLSRLALGWLLMGALMSAPADAQTKLLRFPDLQGDQIVFSYAGDLWLASTEGGTARRLTAHPGLELFPKLSPDGQWVAFTGQYDGDEQAYVIPTAGGSPVRLTYYPARGPLPPRWGYDHQVYGWTPDGKAVLFRSLQDGWDLGDSRLYTVPLTGGLPEALPMPQSGAGDLSPDGSQVVYSPLFRDFRSWKRYSGGWAQDLYIFDLASHQTTQITDHVRTDRDPMWIGDEIYFASDRDGTLNLYAYDIASRETRQVTHSQTWDVRWPSAGDRGRIVYELDGEIQLLDTATGQSHKVSIQVPSDLLDTRPSRVKVADLIEDAALSPKGERVLFVARGDVFSAPAEHGPTHNLTHSSNAHDKEARWSPDGSKVLFISDRDGEENLYWMDQDGFTAPERLTDLGAGFRYNPQWSPKGDRVVFSDQTGRLFVFTVAGRQVQEIAKDAGGNVGDYTWSPQGAFLAFSLSEASGNRALWIWSAADGKLHRVTDGFFHTAEPVWDPAGNYLFFVSVREFHPQISSVEWNFALNREDGIFALALRKDVAHPFPPQVDEVEIDKGDEGDKGSKGEASEAGKATAKAKRAGKKQDADAAKGEGDDEEKPLTIDFEGLGERVARVPLEADNYNNLSAVAGHLLYVRGGPFYYGRGTQPQPELRIFSLEDREEKTLAEGINGYTLSADGSKVLVAQNGRFQLFDAKPGAQGKAVSTDGLWTDRVPKEEWAQIFDEVWRRYRDFFYVSNMHGYDWKALRHQYEPLLEHVGHRADLNYVLSEMISELSVSHAYIQGGDFEIPDRPQVALPGARFELDRDAQRYRIREIFPGNNEEPDYRSPLTEVGVDIQVGDYVLAVDGVELSGDQNPYALLQHQGDQPVVLTVNGKPSFDGARRVTFRPIRSENDLIYLKWVEGNLRKVSEMTDGQVGYLHIPDMGANGLKEFIKWFYPQIRKEALIIDVRGNGGGNVSQMLIERLRRGLLALGFSRNDERTNTYPWVTFYGNLVCLINETSASDGDIFPAMFQEAGLGPLIGKRTWGGVVGISGHGPLLDGAQTFVPEFGFANTEGQWIIEGHGVTPNIEVENDPLSILEGRDLQLERGVEEILQIMKAHPKTLPTRPAAPVKTR